MPWPPRPATPSNSYSPRRPRTSVAPPRPSAAARIRRNQASESSPPPKALADEDSDVCAGSVFFNGVFLAHLLGDQQGHPVTNPLARLVHGGLGHAELAGEVGHPRAGDAALENRGTAFVEAGPHGLHGQPQMVILPFLLPDRIG